MSPVLVGMVTFDSKPGLRLRCMLWRPAAALRSYVVAGGPGRIDSARASSMIMQHELTGVPVPHARGQPSASRVVRRVGAAVVLAGRWCRRGSVPRCSSNDAQCKQKQTASDHGVLLAAPAASLVRNVKQRKMIFRSGGSTAKVAWRNAITKGVRPGNRRTCTRRVSLWRASPGAPPAIRAQMLIDCNCSSEYSTGITLYTSRINNEHALRTRDSVGMVCAGVWVDAGGTGLPPCGVK